MMELGIRHLQLNKKETGHSINEKVESTNYLVSQVAYLLGVRKSVFENDYSNLQLATFKQMDEKSEARIVRNLCIVRTCLMRKFRHIANAIRYEVKNLDTLPDLIPQEVVSQLAQDGVELIKPNHAAEQYLIDINALLAKCIDTCQSEFPLWLKWDYIRSLFLMPNGNTSHGTKAAFEKFHKNMMQYPYQVYLNWIFFGDEGNILYNDEKLVNLLYRMNNDSFSQVEKTSDVGVDSKAKIYDFILNSNRTIMVVDCENVDPYKLNAMLHALDQTQLEKLGKIILIDDALYTPGAWEYLEEYTFLNVERVITHRLKEQKYLVDITLSVRVAKEFYQGNADSFLLLSSDSDFWALVNDLQEARFFILAEREKCSSKFLNALYSEGTPYGFIDRFCAGNCDLFKQKTLVEQLQKRLDSIFKVNLSALLSDVINDNRAVMSETERKQFFGRYVKPMRVSITGDGELHLLLGE